MGDMYYVCMMYGRYVVCMGDNIMYAWDISKNVCEMCMYVWEIYIIYVREKCMYEIYVCMDGR